MQELVSGIANAISITNRLREVSNNVRNAEFNNLLADLACELANAKLEVASLKSDLALTKEQLIELQQAKLTSGNEKPIKKWGCYKFPDEEGLFCTACYDLNGKKISVTRLSGAFRSNGSYTCPVCKAVFS